MADWIDVSDVTPRIAYTATASQTAFTVPFVFFGDDDLFVYQNTVLLTLDTDYTVSGAEDEDGGTVTLLTGATVGDEILIAREIEIVQTTHIPPSGPLDIPAINIQISKLIAIDQQLDNKIDRSIHFPDSDSTLSGELAPVVTRKNKLFGFDTDGSLIYPLGPSFVGETATGVAHVDSRATAEVTSFDISVNIIVTGGYATPGDAGDGIYSRGTATSVGAFQDSDSVWWNLVISGSVNLRALGAGRGVAASDAAAMTAALTVVGHTTGYGIDIIIPVGTYDFSTGQFTITKHGTRILGEGNQNTIINYNPSGGQTLFTFYIAGDVGGLASCEISNLQIASSNTAQKYIVNVKNTTFFLLDHVNMQGISDSGGGSIGILNQGRNYLTVRECIINADHPHYIAQNPMRASVDFEDADFLSFERCQLTCLNAANAIHFITDVCNVTNWSNDDCDWALGRYGVLNIDTASPSTSNDWFFNEIRREQEQGASPTMFAILRSGAGVLRNLSVSDCSTANTLFNLTGIERATFNNATIFFDSINVGVATSTVTALKWEGLFAGSNTTLSLSGQTLVEGRDRQGGTTAAPIYRDATYTNDPQGTITWIGAPSANGRRMGLWRIVADVPVHSGSNDLILLPWTLYTIQYAEIRVTNSGGVNGVATFLTGQVAPAGCTVLSSQTNFAVDGAANHLSVFHFSDSSVGIINKLAGSAGVTVEVLFTI